MLLCIDTGNTNTVFSIWNGERFLAHWRIATDHRRTADEYFVWLSTLIAGQRFDLDIDACIISSTAPRVVFNLRVLCNRYFDTRPLVVGKPDCLLPVAPRVDAGTVVGPDRLVNTLGAFDRHGPDLIVVDFGTATTVDVVDGVVRQIRAERDRPMKVIATGGLAPLFDQGFDLFDAIEDDLTMHGLRLIHDYNKEMGNG